MPLPKDPDLNSPTHEAVRALLEEVRKDWRGDDLQTLDVEDRAVTLASHAMKQVIAVAAFELVSTPTERSFFIAGLMSFLGDCVGTNLAVLPDMLKQPAMTAFFANLSTSSGGSMEMHQLNLQQETTH